MVPVVALIGRSNVGKSTLFNYLTHTCDALVANFSGFTYDRKYGRAKIGNCEFICIDTGGINYIEKDLEMHVTEQSLLAIEEANIILFIVDSRSGILQTDIKIAKYLHSCNKPTLLVANKIDGIDFNQVINEFYLLGLGQAYPIAALFGNGVANLLKKILTFFFDKKDISLVVNKKVKFLTQSKVSNINSQSDCNIQDIIIKLAIVGCPNVGKSTLINSILGKKRMVVSELPGTTRDSIYIPVQHNNRKYILIDTAGVRKRSKITAIIEKLSVIKTLQAIEDANVVILVIDACNGVHNQDLSLISFILKTGRSLIIAINKWDSLSKKIKEFIKKDITYRLSFIAHTKVHFISALYGGGINNLFKSVCEAYDSSIKHISTAVLNRLLVTAVTSHQPPLIRGRRIKMKYAHIGGYNPLIVIIHGNQVKHLPVSYKRYLIKYFCKSLKIISTPLYIQFKENNNPFIL